MKRFRQGFTLMEILISLLIVAIIASVTLPVINKQIDKTDELAYYVAFKTVEKMASQVMTYGDPQELDDTAFAPEEFKISDRIKLFFSDGKNHIENFFITANKSIKMAKAKLFHELVPEATADTDCKYYEYCKKKTVRIFDSDTYDSIWLGLKVANGESVYKYGPSPMSGLGGTYYSCDDFDNCSGYVASDNYVIVKNLLPEYSTASTTTLVNYILNTSSTQPSMMDFCTSLNFKNLITNNRPKDSLGKTIYFYNVSASAFENPDDADSDVNLAWGGSQPATEKFYSSPVISACYVTIEQYATKRELGNDVNTPADPPTYAATYCTDNMGKVNMTNQASPYGIDCVCKSGYSLSANNDEACCQQSSGSVAYYTGSACLNCPEGQDYNPDTKKCCPTNSVYVAGDVSNPNANYKGCKCADGFSGENCNIITSCPHGLTLKTVNGVKTCIANPPLVNARRFCEQIVDSYNVKSYDCSKFTDSNPNYRQDVYEAAMSNSETSKYLGLPAKKEAFKNLDPNVVFNNGLTMWILGDRAASIPGLTFSIENMAGPKQNICKRLKNIYTQAACNANDSSLINDNKTWDDGSDVDAKYYTSNKENYFCKSDNSCFTLISGFEYLGDARNCCNNTDVSELAEVASNPQTVYSQDDYKKDRRSYAISGFTVFVDINGKNKGTSTLWEDVYPFFIGHDGTVYPGYPMNAYKDNDKDTALYVGGNGAHQLAVDVFYYEEDATNDSRKKIILYPNVSYARGLCFARKVSKYAPYCLNFGGTQQAGGAGWSIQNSLDWNSSNNADVVSSSNLCDTNKCYISIKKKVNSF